MNKSWYESKTLWFNILAGAASIFGAGGMFGHVLAPEEVGGILGLGNILLRVFTDKGLVR